MKTDSPLFLGIDVGTGSARAGLFTPDGRMLGHHSQKLRMWKPAPDHVEQSSEDIWRACGVAVRGALRVAGARSRQVAGIGIDATCSLVVLDSADRPVSISSTGRKEQNVVVWMDHRAKDQATAINRTRHPVLRYVGGAISPEMQTPKLCWLKKHLPHSWQSAARFLDLPDFLSYRATGDDTRSLCTTVCKWTYLGHRGLDGKGWDASYFRRIGLSELVEEDFRRIGTRIRPMGDSLGSGLTVKAAKEWGLEAGTPVGVGIIDAHAGGLGVLGAPLSNRKPGPADFNRRLALIGGTSSCHMAVSSQPRFIQGVWGPYHSAMIPDYWLTEGGQSATGALIDHVIFSHAAAVPLMREARALGETIYQRLNARLETMAEREGVSHPAALTADLHVQPDFHGNRSPRADASLRGVVSGLGLSATADDLARIYLAAIQAVAYGTRHIVGEMNKKGYSIDTLMVCGGGTKNPVFLREHADITGCQMVLPEEPEAVLLGSAVLASVAAGQHRTVASAMAAMNVAAQVIRPAGSRVRDYHARKFEIFHQLHHTLLKTRHIMSH